MSDARDMFFSKLSTSTWKTFSFACFSSIYQPFFPPLHQTDVMVLIRFCNIITQLRLTVEGLVKHCVCHRQDLPINYVSFASVQSLPAELAVLLRCTRILEVRSGEAAAGLIINKQRQIWRIKPVSKKVERVVCLFFYYRYACQKTKQSGCITSTFLVDHSNNSANNNDDKHWNLKINSAALYHEAGENMKNTVK